MILKIVKDPATGKQHETLLKGVSSQNNGDFSAEDLPTGNPLKISISAIGYQPQTQMVVLSPRESDKDLGKLPMTLVSKELQQVVVTASKPTMSVDMEKKVFSVTKDIMSIGGNGPVRIDRAGQPLEEGTERAESAPSGKKLSYARLTADGPVPPSPAPVSVQAAPAGRR